MTKKPDYYFRGRKCARCGNDKTTQGFGGPRWHRYYDGKGNWDGKSYLCRACYGKMKTLSRNKSLPKNSNTGKGYIGEQIFCNTRGLKNCNIEKDNFALIEDTIDPEYGIVQVKLTRQGKRKSWKVHIEQEHHFDHLVIICMSDDMKDIVKIYIIPESELYGINNIDVGSYDSHGKYDEFRVDEKPYNYTYHAMSIDNCPILETN